MSKRRLLFLIIFIEGYVVLATELLAIRGLVPFVGSGIEVVCIIIGAVLLPLAVGYYVGGRRVREELKSARASGRHSVSIRLMLERNLLTSLIILSLGLSYPINRRFFELLQRLFINDRIVQTAIYSAVFLLVPVYLLAQTVPLISNYFSRTRLAEITGRILFFSTTGSFLGSILSTLVLMTLVGVHYTVIITLCLVALLVVLVSPRGRVHAKVLAVVIALVVGVINSGQTLKNLLVVADTPYSIVRVWRFPGEDGTILSINHSYSSKYAKNPENRFEYIRYVEQHFITPLKGKQKRSFLILGAGGFVIGSDDKENDYTFVDIDWQIKDIAEKYFLPQPVSDNKHFIATSARSFLRRTDQTYDMVFVDLYSNVMTVPMEAVTREFLLDVQKVLKPDGVLISNIISDPAYDDRYSVRYYNTFASVFPVFDRVPLGPFDGWAGDGLANTLYVYFNKKRVNEDRTVYTDDKNSYSLDH